MPCYKKEPVFSKWKARDFWGDEDQGEQFALLLDEKFGTKRGARKLAMSVLNISRRLLNMYIVGERRVPDPLWATLTQMQVFDPNAVWDDGIDPLS